MTQTDGTLTTQQPGQPPTTRPVPPSWATVAPLLARWEMALTPGEDGLWTVQPHWNARPIRLEYDRSQVPFAELPQVIADVAAQCAAALAQGALPCGHPAAAFVDRPSWGWCSLCAQQAEAALPAPAPSRPGPREEEA